MCQKPEVTDANESGWQHMQQESAQEFAGRESRQPLFVFVSGVAPAEGDCAVGKCDKSMV
jgi:hypothetical protein